MSFKEVRDFLDPNDWTLELLHATLTIVFLLLMGYLLFNLYRGLIYQYLILGFKTILANHFSKLKTCRDKIKVFVYKNFNRKKINFIEAEHIYQIIRIQIFSKFHKKTESHIGTSLHFLYYVDIILLICASFHFSEYIVFVVFLIFSFFIILIMDMHYENFELLLFQMKRRKSEEIICKLIN